MLFRSVHTLEVKEVYQCKTGRFNDLLLESEDIFIRVAIMIAEDHVTESKLYKMCSVFRHDSLTSVPKDEAYK